MQLMLISGIVFAIGAVVFALQNNALVTVTIAIWHYEGSLAIVLLVALGLGALIAALLSSPAVIRRQWVTSRLRRQVADLEREVTGEKTRNNELVAEMARLAPSAETDKTGPEKTYVGLRSLFANEKGE
ncbi:LapA family protein [Propionivibrio sp.]|uniref:LapA family protein n=1 Tax=Propionivibrio sp. TaxID=2212460 RepID=UPI003BF37744